MPRYWTVAIVAGVVAAYAAAAGVAFELLKQRTAFLYQERQIAAAVWPVTAVLFLTTVFAVRPLGRVWSFARRRHQEDALPKARVL